jgi:hypothetical protein
MSIECMKLCVQTQHTRQNVVPMEQVGMEEPWVSTEPPAKKQIAHAERLINQQNVIPRTEL